MMDFARIRGCIFALHLCLMFMGGAFLFEVLQGGSPITPELYGSRVYEIDAWIWAAIQFCGCGVAALGAISGGRYGAVAVVLGSVMAACMFGFFAAMAREAPNGTLAFYGSALLTLPLCTMAGISALNYLLWGDDD